jgi:competence protein ComEA
MTTRFTASESTWNTRTPRAATFPEWKRCAYIAILLLALPVFGIRAQQLPDGPGKSAVLKVCGGCHGPKQVIGQAHTEEEWGRIVGKMAELGAEGTDDEFNAVVGYLAAHFPKATSSKKVNVNKSSAKDLEAALELTAKEAEAIVRYREENGNFKSLDQLKKVPGLDYKSLETKKERLEY